MSKYEIAKKNAEILSSGEEDAVLDSISINGEQLVHQGTYLRETARCSEETSEFEGHVSSLWIEQEEERNQVRFKLIENMEEVFFKIDLSEGFLVVLAQIKLLRRAIAHDWLVTVRAEPFDVLEEYGNVYWLRVQD